MLRHPFPKAGYNLFEGPDVVARFRHDPQGFLDGVKLPAILDEIQYVFLVHRPARSGAVSRALAAGVQALPWQEFVTEAAR